MSVGEITQDPDETLYHVKCMFIERERGRMLGDYGKRTNMTKLPIQGNLNYSLLLPLFKMVYFRALTILFN